MGRIPISIPVKSRSIPAMERSTPIMNRMNNSEGAWTIVNWRSTAAAERGATALTTSISLALKSDSMVTGILSYLKESPPAFSAFFKFGIEAGPIPWRARISFSEYPDSFLSVVIPWFSNALLAGAFNPVMNPEAAFLRASHLGQVGQSEILKYRCPWGHTRADPRFRSVFFTLVWAIFPFSFQYSP